MLSFFFVFSAVTLSYLKTICRSRSSKPIAKAILIRPRPSVRRGRKGSITTTRVELLVEITVTADSGKEKPPQRASATIYDNLIRLGRNVEMNSLRLGISVVDLELEILQLRSVLLRSMLAECRLLRLQEKSRSLVGYLDEHFDSEG